MNELEIDLTGYDSDFNRYGYGHFWNHTRGIQSGHLADWRLASPNEAKRAVKDSGLTRKCDKVDKIVLKIPSRVTTIHSDFLMHFLGPAARKLTPPVLESKLVLNLYGSELAVAQTLDGMGREIRSYLLAEVRRIAERAKKKAAKKPENTVWGEPTSVFVPDINTKLRLVLPWNFTIFREHRNQKFLAWIHNDPNFSGYRHYRDTTPRADEWPIQIKEGSIIIVDRVYIRQGKGFEDYSSLTFRIQKGSTVVLDCDTITAKGNHRFWAKLRDVNKIVAEIDLNSLPGQEKEGTARK